MIGMGPSEAQFYELVGQQTEDLLNHPHSEFVEILWQGGFPGLILYLCMLVAIYKGVRPPPHSAGYLTGIATQGVLVAGMISGLAVGNIFITSPRLATFGLAMAFAYGRMIRDVRLAAEPEVAPEEELGADANVASLPAKELGGVQEGSAAFSS
jgi:hypothetical protein